MLQTLFTTAEPGLAVSFSRRSYSLASWEIED